MRIMILTDSMEAGGAQTHIFELARGLAKHGHKVILVSGGGSAARALSRLGVRCYCLKTDAKKPLSILGGFIALSALIKRERPSVIHAHSRVQGALCRILKAICADFPVYISTVHAHFSTDSALQRLPWYSGRSIAVSEDLKQYIINLSRGGALPEMVEVIPNGIDTARFSPRKREREDGFRLCFMSRLDADCSDTAYLLCRVADKLCEVIVGAEIYIIGGGSELAPLEALAEKANKKIGYRAVRMLGRLDAPELVLSRCDGFIGVSRAALEAMSCGLPVILSGNEGFFGLISGESDLRSARVSNFCCRGACAPSEELILESIFKLYALGDSGRAALGASMRQFVLDNNSSKKMVVSTELFYRRAISEKKHQRRGVLLCGYYGFGNMGDDALLLAACEHAKKEFYGAGITALTAKPRQSREKFGVRCVCRSNPFAVAREIRGCSAFVLGGGSLLQSATSFRSLCWYCALVSYAAAQGKRIYLWGNGLGGFSGSISRRIAASNLNKATHIGVRDRSSVQLAWDLLGSRDSRVALESDLAYGFPSATDERVEYILSSYGIDATEKFAVVALKGTSPRRIFCGAAQNRDFARVRRILFALQDRGVRLVFVSMYPRVDSAVSKRFSREFDGTFVENIGASDLIGIIGRASAVVSMRYHALLFAQKLGKRLFPVGNDPKLLGF